MGKMDGMAMGRSCLKEITILSDLPIMEQQRTKFISIAEELHFIPVLEFGSCGLPNPRTVKVFR
jgi:hypothetical protein